MSTRWTPALCQQPARQRLGGCSTCKHSPSCAGPPRPVASRAPTSSSWPQCPASTRPITPRSRSNRFSAPALALLRGLRLTAARFISSAGALDKKAVDAIVLRLIDKFVARELAKDLEVGDGSRISCQDLKRPALRDLGNGFLRFEDWQRAVQTPRVERLFWHQMVSARREDLRFVYGNLDGVSSSQGL